MKMLYIKISLCFTYLLQKCMPTNHLNAYTAYVPFFSPLGVPICIHVQRFFLTKENNNRHSFKLSCVSVLCKMV